MPGRDSRNISVDVVMARIPNDGPSSPQIVLDRKTGFFGKVDQVCWSRGAYGLQISVKCGSKTVWYSERPGKEAGGSLDDLRDLTAEALEMSALASGGADMWGAKYKEYLAPYLAKMEETASG